MKRLILFISLNLFVLCSLAQDKMYPEGLSIPNTEYYKEMSKNPDFIAVYKEAIKLNKDRFSDINLIQIGDTIYFPNLNEVGIEKIIIKKTDTKNGVDCIWNISKKKYNEFINQKKLKEANEFKQNVLFYLDSVKAETKNISKSETKNNIISISSWIILVLCLLLCLLIFPKNITYLVQKFRKKDSTNKKYYIVDNLSLLSTEEKISFFEKYLNPKEKIKSIESGVLKRHFGKKYLKIKIFFNNNFSFIYLHEGDRLTKVIIKSGYNNCYAMYFTEWGGNRLYPRKNQMIIPANWYFDPDFKK